MVVSVVKTESEALRSGPILKLKLKVDETINDETKNTIIFKTETQREKTILRC